jgi:ATP-dependent DNA ligase
MKLIRPTLAYQIEPAACSGEVSFASVLNGDYDDGKHYAEEKFDGLRYLAQVNPMGAKQNYLTSRRISVVTKKYVEKQDKVPNFRDYKFPKELDHCVFDGEFCSEGISSDTQHAMAQGKGHYNTWDILIHRGTLVTGRLRSERRLILLEMQEKYPAVFAEALRLVPHSKKPSKLLAEVIARKGEGIILKPNATYGEGWLKVKGCIHEDCIITGFEMSTEGKYHKNGWIKNVVFAQYVRVADLEVGIHRKTKWALRCHKQQLKGIRIKDVPYVLLPMGKTSGMTEELREELTLNQKKFIGKPFEVEAHLRLPSGLFRSPRFNRWRFDKNPEQCVWRNPLAA